MISMGVIGIYNSHRLWKYNRNRLPEYMQKWTFRNKTYFIYILSIIPTFFSFIFISLLFFGEPLIDVLTVFAFCKCILRPPLEYLFFKRNPLYESDFVIMIWYLLFFVFPYLIFGIPQPWLLDSSCY